jgi:hypothetical protein
MKEFEEKLSLEAKTAFDESVDSLDAATLSRLNRGRQAALLAARRPDKRWSHWMPAAGVAAALMIAVVMTRSPVAVDIMEAPTGDFEILLSEENIDLFEDLEFYSWLDSVDESADVG